MFEDSKFDYIINGLSEKTSKADFIKAMLEKNVDEQTAELAYDAYNRGATQYWTNMVCERERANRAEAKLAKLSMKVVEVLFLSDDEKTAQ